SARGSHQGETPDIFIVLSGFATTDLSVSFCDACQGGPSLWKNGRCAASPSPHHAIARFSRAFIRMLLPLAAAERQERSD
ncbi:hypothetical protein QUH12_27975, partial [Klebsiella pneumoniae]|nr:hypothetical protein [Klebsiella pneumoniae]